MTVAPIVCIEILHAIHYGHLVGYGIHADVVRKDADIGAPGVKRLYTVRLTNYTVLPYSFEQVRFPGGYLGSGNWSKYEIQKRNAKGGEWSTVVQINPTEANLNSTATKKLWPGQSFFPIPWDPVEARSGVQTDDTIRFAVYKNLSDRAAVYSTPLRVGGRSDSSQQR
jgi:hypothetical protein